MPKPASLMMFLMLRDNDAHALFNIWRLPQLLRLYNINFHDQNPYDQKFPYKKKKKYIYIYIFSQPMPHHHKKINVPPKFHHNQKFPHIHTQLPNFFHSHAKKFLHVQDKKNSHKFMPMHK